MKRGILAVLAVFFTFQILDYLIHGVILTDSYAATSHLWRSEQEMNYPLIALVTLIFSVLFVILYARLAADKGIGEGLTYGLLMGLMMGISMGFGSYLVMPITCTIAWTWFLGTVVEMTVAGLWLGLIVRECKEEPAKEEPQEESA